MKIVYLTPSLYIAGGLERVLTLKVNYFADIYGYKITIILTDGKEKPFFYPLSNKVEVINLNLNFDDLWSCGFAKKVVIYLWKQYRYKILLKKELIRIKPNITISLLRREINFLNKIKDGSRKIGEMHINRVNYRTIDSNEKNVIKSFFEYFWSKSLIRHLSKLDRMVVLTDKDREMWKELSNVVVIPNPLSFTPKTRSSLNNKRVLAIARYSHEKGIDLLLQAWSKIEKRCDWRLDIFGDGDTANYEQMISDLGIDADRCTLNGRTDDVEKEYCNSSLYVLSSRFEGFGIVLLEAMACGLPIVSFDCPWGPRSIISDRKDGLLVENGNVDALSEAMFNVISTEELRKELASSALMSVRRFQIDEIALHWKSLFEEVLS